MARDWRWRPSSDKPRWWSCIVHEQRKTSCRCPQPFPIAKYPHRRFSSTDCFCDASVKASHIELLLMGGGGVKKKKKQVGWRGSWLRAIRDEPWVLPCKWTFYGKNIPPGDNKKSPTSVSSWLVSLIIVLHGQLLFLPFLTRDIIDARWVERLTCKIRLLSSEGKTFHPIPWVWMGLRRPSNGMVA